MNYGSGNLPSGKQKEHESALVRKGSTLKVYEEEADTRKNLGLTRRSNTEIVENLGEVEIAMAKKDKHLAYKFDDLEEDFKFVACTAGNNGNL